MIGRETRMLLRHYLEQGGSKSAVARQLGINRDTLHRWIERAIWIAIFDATPLRYGPRPPVPTKLDPWAANWCCRLSDFRPPQLSVLQPPSTHGRKPIPGHALEGVSRHVGTLRES
jgi:hypothetical protein